ncbi:kinase-like domain, phloem protein 2-like protein, partial [Tanacetum coccineum]
MFITIAEKLTLEEFKAQEEIKRLSILKDKEEKIKKKLENLSPQVLKAQAGWRLRGEKSKKSTTTTSRLEITKINSKCAAIRIVRNINPLNLTVINNFIVKMLGLTEWLKMHALASKSYTKPNNILLKILKAKFKWLKTQAGKLDISPPPQLKGLGEEKKTNLRDLEGSLCIRRHCSGFSKRRGIPLVHNRLALFRTPIVQFPRDTSVRRSRVPKKKLNNRARNDVKNGRWGVMRKFYAEFLHLQIPLPEIVTATSNFAAENLIKEDSFGKDYKGQMLRSGQLTDIVARRLDCIYGQEVKLFGAISIHSSLQHKNIISFIGFCNENDEKIIIYEHAARGSLDQHLTDATLTWFRRLQICIGVARALSHVHYDVIHCDINSSKIFLDEDWEAKLSGFELSTKYPENWRHRILFSHHFDSSGNIDPMYLKSAIVTPKYDVYSFGVILFEVLCGRKATIGDSGVDQSLAEMAKRHFEDRKLDEIIVEGLRKQMDLESLTI